MAKADQKGLRKRGAGEKKAEKISNGAAVKLQEEPVEVESNLKGEYGSIFILLVLYTLQGLPMGLSAVLPMILKERGVSFSDVGTFSLNSWPFSLKLLWAPLVDTVYMARFGRRKTWMVPSQLLIGLVMLAMSVFVDDLLYVEKPAIWTLTGLFFFLYFLCATQDIAVDGWALTMLRPENVGWAATCNAAGQTLGYAFGFTGYMMLEQLKVVTLASFMFYMGVFFLVATVLIALFKTEAPVPKGEEPEDIATSYRQMFAMLQLRPIRLLIVVLFTWKMAFPITDAIAPLKFQEYGLPKEHLAYMTSILMPLYITLPMVAARWTSGNRPLDLALWVYPARVALVAITALLAYFTPSSVDPVPYGFYAVVMFFGAAGAVASEFIFVAQMSFFARISDPALGGTYMTLLNTLANLGGKWPPTVTFYLVDVFTCKTADCPVQADGFYVVAAICTIIGVLWFLAGAPVVRLLQQHKLDEWKVRSV